MLAPRTRTSVAVAALAAALLAGSAPLRGQSSSVGEWSAVFGMPLVAVHAALMQTGQLLVFDAWEIPGTPSARLWDPATNTYTGVGNGFAELFCAGHILTRDGRLLTAGGHNGAGVGTPDATVFDATTQQWTALPDLGYARWYPSLVQLADGRAFTIGGAISRPSTAEVPEALTLGSGSWSALPSAQKDVGEYPVMLQGPDGRLFVSEYQASQSWLLDAHTGSWTPLGRSPAASGPGVMYRPGQVMMAGGGTLNADPVGTATGVIDLNQPTPTWRQVGSMQYGRSQHNLVLLPDGKVLVVGGAAEVSLISTNAVLPAEIWDPDTETWTTVSAMARPRMYHSIAILLPDGRVLAAGGGRINPGVPDETNGEFYSPPYLFRGSRPTITSAPATVAYGSTFTVTTPDPDEVARVTLVRASSVTHGVNLDQRFFELPFATTAGGVTAQAPSSVRLAPAGDYFVFVLNAAGVPSVGRLVRLTGAPVTPALSIGDASAVEGTASAATLTFSVTLSNTTADTVTVNYATASGTATAGADFNGASGTLTFPPFTASRAVVVTTRPDADVEDNETFSVVLSSPVNATLGDATATGTIVNDDAPVPPALTIGSATVVEGSGGAAPVASFTVTLSEASAANVLVDVRTLAGTATPGEDFTTTNGLLTFAGGSTVQTIQVPVHPDVAVEPDETFAVELFNPVGATLATAIGTGTIVNDDAPVPPALTIGSATVVEGSDGAWPVAGFTVTLSEPSAHNVLVDYRTLPGTATAGADFTTTNGLLTFAGGSTVQTIQVPVRPDVEVELDETFAVELFNPVGATLATAVGTATIRDDDVVGTPTPNAPQGLIAHVEGGYTASFAWQPPPTAGQPVIGYVLDAGFGSGHTAVSVPLGNVTTFSTVAPEGRYYVRVRAQTVAGYGPPSNEVIVATGTLAPPLAPHPVLATVQGTRVTFQWSHGPPGNVATAFQLQAGTRAGITDIGAVTLAGTARTFAIEAPPGTYHVRIVALNQTGASPPSAEVVVGPGAGVCTAPQAPTGLSVSTGPGTIALTWAAPLAGAIPTGYLLQVGAGNGQADVGLLAVPAQLAVGGAVPPGSYSIRLAATNACGASAPSGGVSAVVP